MKSTHLSYYNLKEEALKRYDVDPDRLDDMFKKLYPKLYPLGEEINARNEMRKRRQTRL